MFRPEIAEIFFLCQSWISPETRQLLLLLKYERRSNDVVKTNTGRSRKINSSNAQVSFFSEMATGFPSLAVIQFLRVSNTQPFH